MPTALSVPSAADILNAYARKSPRDIAAPDSNRRWNRPTLAALDASTPVKTFRLRSPEATKIVGLFVGLSQNRAEIYKQIQIDIPIVWCPQPHHRLSSKISS
jgi:hypothetical protein